MVVSRLCGHLRFQVIPSRLVQRYSSIMEKQNGIDNAETAAETFYYFGYGSNMLAKRIRIQNPSAEFIGKGKLKNYRLDFNTPSVKWLGSPATIVPHEGNEVQGTIWKINCTNLKDLDSQEGVETGLYIPISIEIITKKDGYLKCRSYIMKNQPETELTSYTSSATPIEHQPSKTYLKTLVKGAMETGISELYIDYLKSIKHNGNIVDEFEKLLELDNVEI